MERTEVTSSLATKQVLTQLATRFGLVGESPLMMQAISRLLQVAPTDLTVLITGETGTGKEVFAHAVHELSQRKKAPFVGVNCAAIPETLLESELFGAEKGAYTGSVEQRKGFFETAHKGTIFLDEIGEMPIGTQVKLLRILESGEYSRLGSSGNLKVDVRVVAATNKDLSYEVRQGRFRQDLFFRLNSVNIVLPPLRQHPDDIPLLVEHFAQKVAEKNHITYQGIDADATAVLEAMQWQGNVRELRNIVETMVTLEKGSRISTGMIQRYLPQQQTFEEPRSSQAIVRLVDQASTVHDPDAQMIYRLLLQLTNDVNDTKTVLRHLVALGMESVTPSSTAIIKVPQDQPIAPLELNLAAMERGAIEEALRRSKGNRREAADMLGISERTLYRKITEYQLD